MASLTEVSFYTRKTIKWGIILTIGFFVLKNGLKFVGVTWKKLNPPKPPAPTVYFGKLPPIYFPGNKDLPELTFSLETIEGKLPPLTDVAKIYFIPKKIYSYLTYEKALNKASLLGFRNEPIQALEISESTYKWTTEEVLPSFLTMDIVDQNFEFNYTYEKDQSLLNIKKLLNSQQASQELGNFFGKAGFPLSDMKTGSYFIYYRYSPPNLVRVSSLSEADFIKVNFLRKEINKMEVFPSDPWNANISGLVSKSTKKRILEAKYTYFPTDKEVWGTYPLKDTVTAWADLKNGQGYIAHLGDNQAGKITIRKVYLAYFDSPDHQTYLQPIFVFEGDREFLAYIPAISDKWTEK